MKVFEGTINLFLEESTICCVNRDLKPYGREAESIFTQAGKDFQRQLVSQNEDKEIELYFEFMTLSGVNLEEENDYDEAIIMTRGLPLSGVWFLKADLNNKVCASMAAQMDFHGKIIWCKVTCSSSNQPIISVHYVDATEEHGACPKAV
ncbi:hypothetical protein CHS0354_043170 [Potamilus streckersoni]|uniref:Uncharacterized protein n=1 Tax=Potamilus streckersoni TaxID=2493646 RepID=A0AAE0SP74_9BIVA|nr:hypothetical protein CHS0354_043170 [Potamilus streckersoni]